MIVTVALGCKWTNDKQVNTTTNHKTQRWNRKLNGKTENTLAIEFSDLLSFPICQCDLHFRATVDCRVEPSCYSSMMEQPKMTRPQKEHVPPGGGGVNNLSCNRPPGTIKVLWILRVCFWQQASPYSNLVDQVYFVNMSSLITSLGRIQVFAQCSFG